MQLSLIEFKATHSMTGNVPEIHTNRYTHIDTQTHMHNLQMTIDYKRPGKNSNRLLEPKPEAILLSAHTSTSPHPEF